MEKKIIQAEEGLIPQQKIMMDFIEKHMARSTYRGEFHENVMKMCWDDNPEIFAAKLRMMWLVWKNEMWYALIPKEEILRRINEKYMALWNIIKNTKK